MQLQEKLLLLLESAAAPVQLCWWQVWMEQCLQCHYLVGWRALMMQTGQLMRLGAGPAVAERQASES